MINKILAKLGITEVTQRQARALLSNPALHSVQFPWNELSHTGFPLVAYGSLLNPDSARRTIPDTPPQGHPPVMAWGARRVFNYIIPPPVFLRYSVAPKGNGRAALNAEQAGGDAGINGRLIQVSPADLPALRQREAGYDLVPVAFTHWGDPIHSVALGYVLAAPARPNPARDAFVDNSLAPYPPYFAICKQGAELVGPEFLDVFMRTTFLTDRTTDMIAWERSLTNG